MKLTKYSQLKDGMRVKCRINNHYLGDRLKNGKIEIYNETKDAGIVFNPHIGGKQLNFRVPLCKKRQNIKNWNSQVENLTCLRVLSYEEVLQQIKNFGHPVKYGVDSNPLNEGGYNELTFDITSYSFLNNSSNNQPFLTSEDSFELSSSRYLLDENNKPVVYTAFRADNIHRDKAILHETGLTNNLWKDVYKGNFYDISLYPQKETIK
jgi:hypothetical protein